MDGAFVSQGEVICQLQTDFDDNEFQKGSKAQEKILRRQIAEAEKSEAEAEKIWNLFNADRKEYLEKRKKIPNEENYYPSGGLDEHDYALVIRTKEITRFILSLEETPLAQKPLGSKERNSLLVLIGALCKEVDIDPEQRGVSSSLVKMTEIIGAPLTDDTIRKILSQIEGAVSTRNK